MTETVFLVLLAGHLLGDWVTQSDWQAAEQGPDAIIQQVRAAEDSDPDDRRWPRGKRHDDATAAYVVLNDATASSD